jgi:cell division protein FtsI (penicillin-binding protein 3)
MLVRRSFGYRIKLAPIQIATLYNAVANDGRMISPILVKELRRGEEVEERFKSETLVNKIASNQTLRQVRSLLETVGVEGTGAAFFGDTTLYRVAAKTGTAQYADEQISYRDGYYIGSMAAYFPAHEPRFTVLTTIFTKQQPGKAYYGGPLSGPVVRDVIRYLYNKHSWAEHASRGPRTQQPTHVKGSLGKMTDEGMPDVTGMGLKEALFLLESKGLRVSFSGAGAVREQSIPVGAETRQGEQVELILR